MQNSPNWQMTNFEQLNEFYWWPIELTTQAHSSTCMSMQLLCARLCCDCANVQFRNTCRKLCLLLIVLLAHAQSGASEWPNRTNRKKRLDSVENKKQTIVTAILFRSINTNWQFVFASLFFCRANNNWQTHYSLISKSNESSPLSTKKQRDVGESARDSLAYSCLLRNELLGTTIDDVKSVADERNENVYGSAKRGLLFKYQSPTKQVSNTAIRAYFSIRFSHVVYIFLRLLLIQLACWQFLVMCHIVTDTNNSFVYAKCHFTTQFAISDAG